MLVAEDFLSRRAGDDGDLRAVDPRFRLWRRPPGLGSGDNFKSGAQRGSLTLAADQCLRLVAVHVDGNHLPVGVQVFARVAGQGKAHAGYKLRRVGVAHHHVGVVAPAFHLIFGKIRAVLLVFESPGVIKHVIHRVLMPHL